MHYASLERIVLWTGLVVLGSSLIALGMPARAAEEGSAAPAAAAKAEAPPAAAKKTAKERQPAGRLPNFYPKIVTEEQREKIFAIQKQYAAKIDPLRRELEKITRERDEAIEALLTPEQKKQLEDLKAAAKAKRDAKGSRSGRSGRSSRSPAAEKNAPAAPPAK